MDNNSARTDGRFFFFLDIFRRFADELLRESKQTHFQRIEAFHFWPHLQTEESRTNAGQNVEKQALVPKNIRRPITFVPLLPAHVHACSHTVHLCCVTFFFPISIFKPFTELNESSPCIQRSAADDLKNRDCTLRFALRHIKSNLWCNRRRKKKKVIPTHTFHLCIDQCFRHKKTFSHGEKLPFNTQILSFTATLMQDSRLLPSKFFFLFRHPKHMSKPHSASPSLYHVAFIQIVIS